MFWRRIVCGGFIGLAAEWCVAAPKALLAKTSVSDQFFQRPALTRFKIEITGTNLTALKRNNRAYARTTVTADDQVFGEVGLHLKGAAGSFRDLNDRPALTLNFDKFKDGQKFHGLDKIHLNNSVQDPSHLTEWLCGEMFDTAGVPAARTTHARVILNGRDLGLYVLKEGFNKTFLKRHFKNPNGNLYDGGFLRDITEPLQLTTGETTANRADLKALAAAAQEPDLAKRLVELEKVLNLDQFLSFIALDVMMWDWDGYAMKRNNYKVYHDPATGKITFFPHGMDQMFSEPEGSIMPGMEGLVARALVQIPEGRRRYREKVSELLTNVFRVDALTNRVNELHARLRPAFAEFSQDAARDHANAVNNLKNQIVARAAGIARQLNVPEPQPLAFDAQGTASPGGWRILDPAGTAALEQGKVDEGKAVLRIRAGANRPTSASWRAGVLLKSGRYRFEGQVRTAGVEAVRDERGAGAGLRISGARLPRINQAGGDSPWRLLVYDFDVSGGEAEVVLVCELRATKGEAWFDLASLKLRRL